MAQCVVHPATIRTREAAAGAPATARWRIGESATPPQMHEILIGQNTAPAAGGALSDEDGAGAGIRTRTSSMACSCAAVEHHARSCAGPRRSTCRQTTTCAPACSAARPLAIHVVKERPRLRRPASIEAGVLQTASTKRKRPETCVDPGVHDPEGSGQRRCGLACSSRIERVRIPLALRMLALDKCITPLREHGAAGVDPCGGRRCLGARHWGGKGR